MTDGVADRGLHRVKEELVLTFLGTAIGTAVAGFVFDWNWDTFAFAFILTFTLILVWESTQPLRKEAISRVR